MLTFFLFVLNANQRDSANGGNALVSPRRFAPTAISLYIAANAFVLAFECILAVGIESGAPVLLLGFGGGCLAIGHYLFYHYQQAAM